MNDLKDKISKAFPCTEEFVDCCGETRTFVFTVRELPYSFVVEAEEATESCYGYQFEVFSESDPFIGLGNLRRKIRKAISHRYLRVERGELNLAHDELEGRISSDGIVVDGVLLTWKDLERNLVTSEGRIFNCGYRAAVVRPESFLGVSRFVYVSRKE